MKVYPQTPLSIKYITMSDLEKEVKDLCWEHEQHDYFEKDCSQCFSEDKENKEYLAKKDEVELDTPDHPDPIPYQARKELHV